MVSFITPVNSTFLMTIFFGYCIFYAMRCRNTLSRLDPAGDSGTHEIRRMMMVARRNAARRERKNHIVDLLSILAIIGALICFIA